MPEILSIQSDSNLGAGKCFFCHLNAGASDFFFPGQNANFNTNVEGLPSQPADLVTPAQLNPQDGGFGQIRHLANGWHRQRIVQYAGAGGSG